MYAQIAQHRPSTAGPDRTSFITKSSSCRGKLTGLLRAELPLFTDNSNA